MGDTGTFGLPPGLTDLERRALTAYVSGLDAFTRNALTEMFACVRCGAIDRTGVGFFHRLDPFPDCRPKTVVPDGMLTMAFAFHPETRTQVELLLRIEDGQLRYIEAVTLCSEWPTDEDQFVIGLPE